MWQFENTEHIFTQCVLAKFGWSVLRDELEWNYFPANLDDLHNKLVEGSVKNNSLFVFFFGCFAWSLWLTRNNLVFNDIVVNQPDVIVFRTISFLQKWKLLLREQEQRWMDSVICKLQRQLSLLRSEV
jgi:hypothetical protein